MAASRHLDAQRHVMNMALLMAVFAVLVCVNMLSPVLEARLFALVGVFGVGACIRHCAGLLAGSSGP